MAGDDEIPPTGQMVNVSNQGQNFDDPFYVHPSDNPGQILVSSVFDGTGFGKWKRAITVALEAKCKEGFIDGTVEKPLQEDVNYKRWVRCNAMVISWLVNSMSKDIVDSVFSFETAHDIWVDLCERYGQTNSAELYTVEKQLNDISQETDSISLYYTKLKKSWDELNGVKNVPKCRCGCKCGAQVELEKFEQNRKVIKFLMGLNDSYKGTRGGILQNPPLPSLATAYSILLQEEKQRDISSQSTMGADASAFAMQRKWQGQKTQYGNNKNAGNYQNLQKSPQNMGRGVPFGVGGSNASHGSGSSSGQQGGNASFQGVKPQKVKCYHCGKEGHVHKWCYDLHPELKENKGAMIAANTGSGYSQNFQQGGTMHMIPGNPQLPYAPHQQRIPQQMSFAPSQHQNTTQNSDGLGQTSGNNLSLNQEYHKALAGYAKLSASTSNTYALASGHVQQEFADDWAGA